MTLAEAEEYFETLSDEQKHRFNLLAESYLKLGKPAEGAYDAAKTIIEEKK